MSKHLEALVALVEDPIPSTRIRLLGSFYNSNSEGCADTPSLQYEQVCAHKSELDTPLCLEDKNLE